MSNVLFCASSITYKNVLYRKKHTFHGCLHERHLFLNRLVTLDCAGVSCRTRCCSRCDFSMCGLLCMHMYVCVYICTHQHMHICTCTWVHMVKYAFRCMALSGTASSKWATFPETTKTNIYGQNFLEKIIYAHANIYMLYTCYKR